MHAPFYNHTIKSDFILKVMNEVIQNDYFKRNNTIANFKTVKHLILTQT